ncbi:MAG: myxosortase-dependent metalloprotease, MXAN_2677/MXAN_2678 family, partial [Myxococcales bacterium]
MKSLALGVLLGASLFGAVRAEACLRSTVPSRGQAPGPCLWWGAREVPYAVNELGSARIAPDGSEFTAITASYATWNEPSCSDMTLVEQPRTARTDIGFDQTQGAVNVNLVVFRDRSCRQAAPTSDPCWREGGCNNKFNCWEQSSETIAVTTTSFSNRTGEIFDADLELNGDGFDFTTATGAPCPAVQGDPASGSCVATDLANTVVHEVGHFLGLDHTDVADATMYRSADIGETKKRTLHEDDLACYCAMYPAGRPTVTCITPEPDVAVGD